MNTKTKVDDRVNRLVLIIGTDVLGRWPGKTVVDLVRQWKEVDYDGRYEGLSWGGGHQRQSGRTVV